MITLIIYRAWKTKKLTIKLDGRLLGIQDQMWRRSVIYFFWKSITICGPNMVTLKNRIEPQTCKEIIPLK